MTKIIRTFPTAATCFVCSAAFVWTGQRRIYCGIECRTRRYRAERQKKAGGDDSIPAVRQEQYMAPPDALELALLRFVNCLVRHGASMADAGVIVAGELDRLRRQSPRSRSILSKSGNRWLPVIEGGTHA